MYTIGASTSGNMPTEELFSAYRQHGIEAMEISLKADGYEAMDFQRTAELARAYGIALHSLHLPFKSSLINIARPDLAKQTVARHKELIRRSGEMGAKYCIIHPSGEPITAEERQGQMACACESLYTLAEVAKQNGVILAVEDLPRTCLGNTIADMHTLLSAHPSLRVCFDTNHLLTDDPIAFIRELGDRIVTLHVSDYDFVDERHWLPGEGLLDWHAILEALSAVSYKGVWLYEVTFSLTGEDGIRTLADVAANAHKLLA